MSLNEIEFEKPLYIQVHPDDNVAIIVNKDGLPEGTVFSNGLELRERVPQGHKVTLTDLDEGDAIIRYGQVIGYMKRPLKKGSWMNETIVVLPSAPELDELRAPEKAPQTLPLLEGYTFEGFRNSNGTAGIKNMLGISTSVQCVVGLVEYAVKKIKNELLPKYPHVDDVVDLNHNYGCGVAINSPDAIIPIRTLQNLAVHPSFGGEVMVVGLGCEKLVTERLVPDGDTSNIILLQDQKGFVNMVQTIVEMAEARLIRLNERQRVTCPVSDLVIGVQCGGSDAFSGVTANPAVGYASDLIVRAGGTVMFSEVTEIRDSVHLLMSRVADEKVGSDLVREMKWYDNYLLKGEVDRDANPTPGNKKGGLSNVVEKSLGSVAKSGNSPLVEVVPPGAKPTKKGLLFAATPAGDFVCGTLQLAAGMHLQVFTTGRGTPYGLAMAPVIKVSTRSALTAQWKDLIDVNAGTIATGEATIEEVGWEIFNLILEVASGRKQTFADKWGLHNDLCLFNPAPIT
ncbi:MAG: galactarate dehydratase [Bacillus sp. (in: Bacteria)]|nr:galactarate dehydratase [Bacillus sp. (in: firmicutes)]